MLRTKEEIWKQVSGGMGMTYFEKIVIELLLDIRDKPTVPPHESRWPMPPLFGEFIGPTCQCDRHKDVPF